MACRDGRDCIKALVYFLNACLLILGVGIAGVAGYVAFNKSSVLHNAIAAAHLPGTMTGLYIMFAGGLVIAVVAILTCLATSAENKLLLWLTFFLILMLLIMQLVGVIICFYKYKVVEKQLTTLLKDSVLLSMAPKSSGLAAIGSLLRSVVGKLESTRKCCGLNGPSDYGSLIPDTCRPHTKHKGTSPKGDYGLEEGPIELRDEGTDWERAIGRQGSAISTKSSISSSTTTTTTAATTTTTTTAAAAATTSTTTAAATSTTTTATTAAAAAATTTASKTTTIPKIPSSTAAYNTTKVAKTKKPQATTTSAPAPPYKIGCFQRFKSIIAAAGGVGISVLIAEFVLLICIGLLLCEVGKEYDRLA